MSTQPSIIPDDDSIPGEDDLLVALPEPGISLSQDAEWCVVEVDGEWRRVRFHDYETIFSVPGLYEKVIYEILHCRSPRVVQQMILEALPKAGFAPADLRVLDVGAGNGMVAEELSEAGAEFIVGVDIIQEAADAAHRDRPGLYHAYHVLDLTDLSATQQRKLEEYRFNCLACVAALGFGDIPAAAFASAYNLIQPGGLIAFNIKQDFLTDGDDSGFSRLISRMTRDGILGLWNRQRYPHRLGTDREAIYYVAVCGRKTRDIPDEWIAS